MIDALILEQPYGRHMAWRFRTRLGDHLWYEHVIRSLESETLSRDSISKQALTMSIKLISVNILNDS
jgi:hypothetical protein